MSGPKSADYYLTAEQRRQLAEQRRVNELKKKILNYSDCLQYQQSAVDEYTSNAKELLNLSAGDNGYSVLLEQFESIINELKNTFDSSGSMNESSSLSECFNKLKKLKLKKEAVISKMKTTDLHNIALLKKEYSHQLENAMEADFSGIKSKAQSEYDEIYEKILSMLSESEATPVLSDELQSEIDSAKVRLQQLNNTSLLKNFSAVTVEPLMKRCKEYIGLYNEFKELYCEYTAVCETNNIQIKQFECSPENIALLHTIIEEIHSSADKSDEQEYISRAIDDVMTEMGYKLIGNRSVTKKSGRKFRSELYTFSEGTAVNITHSSNGQITMELAGLDSADRLPTDDESNVLCAEMESFCGSFSEFEKRLAKKGVISRHISILPPSSEYAQIINLNDYEINRNASYSELNAGRINTSSKAERME